MTWKPDYITVATLKNYIKVTNDDDDVFMALWVTAVSRNVDDYCGRQFGSVTPVEERTYTPEYDRRTGKWVVEIDDLQNTTGVAFTNSDDVAITDYTFEPVNALVKGMVYERIIVNSGIGSCNSLTGAANDITGSALWGWTAVPSSVSVGALLQGNRLKARRNSPFGIAGSPTEGSEIRLLAQLDPDFKTALKPYRRNWWAR